MRNDEGALARRPRHSNRLTREGTSRSGRSAPAVVVVFELESPPYFYACWDTDEDHRRLATWLDYRADYAELLHRCIEFSGETA
jgi:hypothetical protein